jgi:hypothetical protein
MGVKVCIFAALLEDEDVKTIRYVSKTIISINFCLLIKYFSIETDPEEGFKKKNKAAHQKAFDAFSSWASEAFGKIYLPNYIILNVLNGV